MDLYVDDATVESIFDLVLKTLDHVPGLAPSDRLIPSFDAGC
jgi:hypothetical protein